MLRLRVWNGMLAAPDASEAAQAQLSGITYSQWHYLTMLWSAAAPCELQAAAASCHWQGHHAIHAPCGCWPAASASDASSCNGVRQLVAAGKRGPVTATTTARALRGALSP